MRKVPFVDLGAQYRSIRTEVEAAMSGVLERCDFILGGSVAEFEAEMAAYCEASFGVGVDSGTSALELALMALDIGPGDEVITAANTFIASTLAISYVGATPVLVDIDPDTYQIDVNQIEAAITPLTKALMPVHLYGHPADMGPILEIASRHGLKVLEDASQAHGARYQGRRVGALGDIGAFSLYPAKNLGAYGDAGVLVTNDPDLDHKLRLLRNYGSTKKYHHDIKGFNRRLDTLPSRGTTSQAVTSRQMERGPPQPCRRVHQDPERVRGRRRLAVDGGRLRACVPPVRDSPLRSRRPAAAPSRPRHRNRDPLSDPDPPPARIR